MFKELFFFELKLWFKRPAVYIFFLIFFAIAVWMLLGQSGVFGNRDEDSNAILNSAKAIANTISQINTGFVGLIILITIIAPAVYKDFQYNMHPLLFTKPISKFGYMIGRFSAAFFIALFVLSGSIFGHMFISAILSSSDSHQFGAFHLMNYVEPFIYFVIPNTLFVGAIFFSLVTFSRNMIAGYVGCIALVVIKNIANALLADIDNQTLAALVEPFGAQAFRSLTKYWSPDEQNNLGVPFEGVLLYNRIIWLAISLVVTVVTYFRFQFSQFNNPITFFRRKNKETFSLASAPVLTLSDIPKATQNFSVKYSWYQIWFLAKFEFNKITRSIFFVIIALLTMASLMLVTPLAGAIYGTSTYPLTHQMLELGGVLSRLFMNIIIIFYAGVLVWRERDAKIEEFIGTAPVRSFVNYSSKLIALILVQALLLLVVMITGIIIQTYYGYYKFEILLYIKDLFGLQLIGLGLTCVLAMSIQAIFNNRYVGYFISILILGIPLAFELFGWKNQMAVYNSNGPEMPYSDMNGYGHIIFPYFIFKLYWIGFAMILIVFSNLMWARGKEKGFKNRLGIARTLFNRKVKMAMSFSILVFLLAGGFIYYNINFLNKNVSANVEEKSQADFEKNYKRYSKTQQPRIIAANWNVDIFPDERGAKIAGYYILKNKSVRNVDSIIVTLTPKVHINEMKFEQAATKVVNDTENGFYIYKLSSPLKPGDSIKLDISIDHFPKGFKSDPETAVVYNGSFFNSEILPSIGYNAQGELTEDAARKKYNLPKKERIAKVTDSLARMNTYISNDADWIDFECTVSTSEGQTAIAPGYLIKKWNENGRNYFHYKMDCKILNFYSFLSARYEVKKDEWVDPTSRKKVAIEVYYYRGHEYNLDRMIRSVKRSLDYYTQNFSPYQHKQVRIVEFSLIDGTFAQSFPNTIPFSEGIGFVAKVNDKDPLSIDYPFYVTAHEVAHQWWAHQVIGGDVQGSTLMSETMSQYSALMVMEKEFGKATMKKFLKYEMKNYLQGRAMEGKKELPLMLVENQQYIHYNKGSIIMYALKDYIGEDSLNAALRKYIKKVAYQEPPYTNSIEFVNYLRAATPDSLKYIINDMFETITFYENKTTKCSYTKTKDGKYLVKVSVESKKMKADSIGKMKDVAEADWIDIGVFGSKEVNGKKTETELYLQKRKITKNKMDFEIIVNELPVKVGIDPYNKLIDRTPDNNVKSFDGSDREENNDGGMKVVVTSGK
jgi:ABC-2 type transport system permease protein